MLFSLIRRRQMGQHSSQTIVYDSNPVSPFTADSMLVSLSNDLTKYW